MTVTYLLILFISAASFSLIGTAILVHFLPQLNWFDVPTHRSNHQNPTPRGGGIAVTFTAAAFLLVAGANTHIVWAAIFLGVVSLIDDVRGLAIRPRLIAQLLAIAYGASAFSGYSITGGIIPLWLEIPIVALVWMWFINLYNFMDGIDGITSAQTISIALGIFILGMMTHTVTTGMQADATILVAAMLGFAVLNWHPARIFLGDVGSVPLGFLVGYLLLLLAAKGEWAAALILPAYYLCDATYTLAKRALRAEKFWQAHSEHAFQKAVRSGYRHDDIVKWIIALNMVLIVLAALSTINLTCGLIALTVAYVLSFVLMQKFARMRVQIIAPETTQSSPQVGTNREFRDSIPDTI
jgi:UDP-N-acetylmuramyl pentapeptide phosphotransferase/UDP-N-acetylglucosamine-1-phosphate transferase